MFKGIGALMFSQSSPFKPTDIAGCILWLSADRLNLNNNDQVSTWTDLSGAGNTVTAPGNKPVYKSTGGPNGKPGVIFDAASSQKLFNNSTLNVNQPNTVFAVFDTGQPWTGDSLVVSTQQFGSRGGVYYIESGITLNSAITAQTGTFVVLSAIFKGATSEIWRNGVQIAAGDAGSGGEARLDMFDWDGSTYSSGTVSELIAYDSGFDSINRERVETYLKSKYNLWV